ncbi:ribosome-associated protein [Litorivivens lipolytica]|uniref:Ribosomal silencing factor RsfS n=1 Tax=Litorivivens lipolytica TaxID=1524264 RepID=A0A7W4W5C3_9GAMM|nr:ribosome silencing factor [Litorivivens lipolytica]MBB3047189.1 ribosome-associated protein [Litorivivens lipolytica]
MKSVELVELVKNALEDMKARDVVVLDVREMTGVTDYMVVASGTSNRHVKSLANNVLDEARQQGLKPMGMEGDNVAEWVLVDFGDVVVHTMLPEARTFYDIERLWSVPASKPSDAD